MAELRLYPSVALATLVAAFACFAEQGSIPLAPFPDMSAPRAVTTGPHDHFLANYFAINAWSPDNRYLLTLETDLKDKLPDGVPCTLGLVDLADDNDSSPSQPRGAGTSRRLRWLTGCHGAAT